MLTGSVASAAFVNVDCSLPADRLALGGTNELAQSDCEFLETIYTDTNPAGWSNNTNWDTLSDVDTWFGLTSNTSIPERITNIELNNNDLDGDIAGWDLSSVTALTDLRLNQNNALTGDLSGWNISALVNLEEFDLDNSDLDGNISGWDITPLTNLRAFKIRSNSFGGDLSGWNITPLSNLDTFALDRNNFTGDISGWNITPLTGLINFSVINNNFTGDLTAWNISPLLSLEDFYLGDNNFTGDLSGWNLTPILSLEDIILGDNNFTGDLSGWNISPLVNLVGFVIDNNDFSGDISGWNISPLVNLVRFAVDRNNFTGDLTAWNVSPLVDIFSLLLRDNNFTGDLSGWNISPLTDMTSFSISDNNFTGDLSGWNLTPLTNLANFFAENNSFTGDLSGWNLTPLTRLTRFNLSNNDLAGDLGSWDISPLTRLRLFRLEDNNFVGDLGSWVVPATSGNLNLNLSGNAFLGDIPDFSSANLSGQSTIGENQFETANAAKNLTADTELGGDWSANQTIAPKNPTQTASTATTATISVDAYEYTVVGDFNLLWGSSAGGPYTTGSSTTARSAGTDLSVTGIAFNTLYYGVVEAETQANGGGNVLVATSTEFAIFLSEAPDLASSSDSGVSDTDDITGDTTPTFTGTCAPGATVSVTVNGAATLNATICPGTGIYSLNTAPALVDGTYEVRTVQNIGGVAVTPSPALTIVVDTVDPIVSASIDTSGGIDDPTVNFSAIETGSGLDRFEIEYLADNDGTGLNATTTIDVLAAGATSLVLDLDGDELTHEVKVRAYDKVGNFTETILRFPPLIDITAPTILSTSTISDTTFTVTSPAGNPLSNIASTLGTVNCESSGNGTGPFASPVSCTLTGIGVSGTATISAEEPATGATGEAAQAYIIDNAGPVITIVDDVLVGPVQSDDFEVNVTDAYPATSTYMYGFSPDATCDATDTYSDPISVLTAITFNTEANNGSYLCVVASDLSGNTTYGGSTNPLNIDVTDPTVDITSPAANDVVYIAAASTTADVLVSGTGEAGSSVTVDDGNINTCTATVDGLGMWSCTVPGVPLGAITFTANATDPAGNTDSDITNIEIKNALDPVTATVGSNGVVVGTGEPLANIEVKNPSGTILCTTTVDTAGDWSCTLSPIPTITTLLDVEQSLSGLSNATTTTFSVTAPPVTSSGGGGGSAKKACRDPEASNYETFGKSDSRLCEYDEDTEEPEKGEEVVGEEPTDTGLIEKLRALIAEILKNKESVTQVDQCPYFTQYMRLGDRDGSQAISRQNTGVSTTINQVARLQKELTSQGFYSGPVSGFFGPQTQQAVNSWQVANKSEVLTPWGLTTPTGWFYQSSERWMNELKGCDDSVRLDNGVQLD